MKRAAVAALAAALVLITVTYRVLSLGGPLGGFENDQFVTLSQAQQMVAGDWPMRDFIDLGMPLTLLISVVGQVVIGHTLFAEALLLSLVLGICAAILFWLSWRITGSIVIALAVALMQIAMAPRFYNFSKLLAYGIAMPLLWRYIDRPTRGRLAALSAAGVIAFLLRLDHGVYVGLTAIATVLVTHSPDWRTGWKQVAWLGAIAFAFVLPFLVYIQIYTGVVTYFQEFARYASQTEVRTAFAGAPISIDLSRKAIERVTEARPTPRINVRWTMGTTGAARADRERALGLINPDARGGDVVNYELTEWSATRLQAIVHDPLIADTSGIDRQTFALNDELYTHAPTRAERVMRAIRDVRILPGVFQSGNAVPFLYYLLWAAPWAALVALVLRREANKKIVVLIVLGLLINRGFLRGNLSSRLADVTEVAGVLIAWVAAVLVARRTPLARTAAAFVLFVLLATAAWSANAIEDVSRQVAQTGATDGVRGLRERAAGVHDLLASTPPVSAWPPDAEGMERLARYVNACTKPDDRVLALGYIPELYFMAARPFAAGSVWIQPRFFEEAADQRLMIARTVRYRVPIAVTVPDPEYRDEYVRGFPLLTGMLDKDYQLVETADFGRGFRFRVLTRRGLAPTGMDAITHLPCFS